MDKNKLMKLAKMLVKLTSIVTDKAELTYEGELEVGVEVYVEVEGEYVPAEDGEYLTEDKKYIVAEGKIVEIVEIEKDPEPEPEPEPQPVVMEDEKDVRIAELEAALAERDERIQDLENKIKELEDQAAQPVDDPVKMNKTNPTEKTTKTGALRYFEK